MILVILILLLQLVHYTDDTFLTLAGANGVDTFTIGANTYAIVTAFNDNGVQIIDISNPDYPSPAGSLTDGANGVDKW